MLAFILLSTSLIPLAVMNFPRSDIGDSTRDSRIEARPNGFAHFYAKLVDTSALQDRPFLLLVCGLLGTFMGIYTIQYYITLFALQETSTADHLSSAVLMIINGASTVGRILPSAIADQIGPVHVLAATALSSCLICFCMRTVHNSVGIIIWAVAFGCTTGAFMALPAAGVVSVSKTRGNIGARLGMTLGTVGCGVLVAEPIAGAILDFENGGWLGLIAWSGSLLSFGGLMVVVARVIKLGWKSRGIV